MYRATAQWFISMDNNELRQKALEEIKRVTWTPAWGMQRIHDMVESRPDWCLSRQRSWGVPLTVLVCEDCGEVLQDEGVCKRIEALFTKEGADAWFKHGVEAFLEENTTCSCGSKQFSKESDILDVWFDSGVSYAAVCEERDELRAPADLYLEGSDQHRGWFQSSLLAAVGTRGHAPYKGVLTHGYVVDGEGKKMSKSVGNVVAPQEVIDQYGAEILRLWVASEDYRDDVKVSDEILKQVSDAYRKMRNTIRFMLSNLYDFDPAADALKPDDFSEIDRWALASFAILRERVCKAYAAYEFHTVYHALHNFCTTTMSNLYLDVLKDRLYVSAPSSLERRAAQTVIHRILEGMLRLMSPVLCFTAAEAWESLQGLEQNAPLEQSIFFTDFPSVDDLEFGQEFMVRWEKLLAIRGEINRVLEAARRDKVIGLALDAELLLQVEGETAEFLNDKWPLLQEICIVSSLVQVEEAGEDFADAEEVAGLKIGVRQAPGAKCERCWTVSPSVGEDAEHPAICSRCRAVVQELPS
jgi:isoleucyl-tRNA synthetase